MGDAMTGLDRLIAAVEAGTATGGDDALAVPVDMSRLIASVLVDGDEVWSNFVAAHDGSLDAAGMIFAALLPARGYQWHLSDEANFYGYVCQIYGCKQDRYVSTAHSQIPARAWLLAVLRAYRTAQEAGE